jgi:hypothetical protein
MIQAGGPGIHDHKVGGIMTNAEQIFGQIIAKGFEALRKFVEDKEPESEWLDFKEKVDASNGKLSDGDKENFAKALSGFLNASGGVLIFGIKGKNRAESFDKILEISVFEEEINSFLPKTVSPLPQGVQLKNILDGPGQDEGYLVIYIPQSENPPHQVVINSKAIQYRYYKRSGDNTVPMSHYELEDLFGRRPHPKPTLIARVFYKGSINNRKNFSIDIGIKNEGRGILKYPCLRILKADGQNFDEYGIDGNRNSGLPKYLSWVDGSQVPFFIGGADHVIPPFFELWVCRYTWVADSQNLGFFNLIAEINGEGILPKKFKLNVNQEQYMEFYSAHKQEQTLQCMTLEADDAVK